MSEQTVRLTVAQATIRFLANQYSERDGLRQRLIPVSLGIFGHGNVAGLGQALLQADIDHESTDEPGSMPYILSRNEQGAVHTAVGFARARNRTQTYAVTTSIGPGATNMVTGAALATINRIPVLLLPADGFANRAATPLLQELERTDAGDVSVNDAFRPVSRYFDRVQRPEQLPAALLGAMRVLTDVAETGAVTVCFPQDVQAEAYDWPAALFAPRVWRLARPQAEPALLDRAAELIKNAQRPLIVAGGGVHYSQAEDALRDFVDQTRIPVGLTQAGKGALLDDHPLCLGAVGSTGTTAANAIAREADLVIGIGTRYSDFTTASRSAFQHPDVRFVNVNVAGLDSIKESGLPLLADARDSLTGLASRLSGHRTEDGYRSKITELKAEWDKIVDDACHPAVRVDGGAPDGSAHLLSQNEVIGMVNEHSDPRDVVVCAAGSMPGDLHKLWRTRDVGGYHVEYGYSCMGYEIAGGLGVRLADPSRDVFVMVGDGSYLMLASELVTAIQEDVKLVVILVQNHGFASIGSLSESLGSQRFGTRYRHRGASGRLDGDFLPIDLAANAASLGAEVITAGTADEFVAAIKAAKRAERSVVIHVETDPFIDAPDSRSWWDVPVSEVSTLESTQQAYKSYRDHKSDQRIYLDSVD
ncbi:3D-(3,5/4)-trihydroxycyclohexane-1,2-dione acylhydrolase (decyclizing) [Microlunatus elymi]|nr:3D-(3,5/4)-trihydroxycyclohexane-1,2-dione acylhydrolase (decyclizing) [Microlunatus elymi]